MARPDLRGVALETGSWCRECLQNRHGLALRLLLAGLIAATAWMTFWVGSYAWAIYRLSGEPPADTVFYARDGRPWFRLEESRRNFALDEFSPHLRNAVIAIEDHRFRYHPGIDPLGMTRAAFRNLRAGGVAEGGSTITQQLARTLFLSNRRSMSRKAKELVLAFMLEQQLSKDKILELYLNRVYLGSSTYGMGMLAERLFGKTPDQLTLPEAALMAGSIRAPATYSPWSNPSNAIERKNLVLAKMQEHGYLEADKARAARTATIGIRANPAVQNAGKGYLQDYLRQQFAERFGNDLPNGWRVLTAVSPEIQEAAERAVTRGLNRFGIPGLQAALVALEPRTGDVLAMVGGRDYSASRFNRATQARRQMGSAFKPFVFAAALEDGMTPVSLLTGLASLPPAGREEWTPQNADGAVIDALPLRAALAESNNVAAVKLHQTVGKGPVLRLARDVGLRDLPDVPSLALGTGAATPLEVARAYAAFPNGGHIVTPRPFHRVLDHRRSAIDTVRPERERALSAESAFQMVSMMQDVIERGTGTAARAHGVRFPVAGKTGTTDDYRDAWFAGFSSSVVAVVWVGFDEPRPIDDEAYASRFALPIWSEFMRASAAFAKPKGFAAPGGVQFERVCRVSYKRAGDRCPIYAEVFKDDDDLPEPCDRHGAAPPSPSFWRRVGDALFGWLPGGDGKKAAARLKH